jgi:hypothetical protein
MVMAVFSYLHPESCTKRAKRDVEIVLVTVPRYGGGRKRGYIGPETATLLMKMVPR